MSRQDIQTGTEQCLAYEEDGVAVITLNRPQARNALTHEMLAGLDNGAGARSPAGMTLTAEEKALVRLLSRRG